jgi:hypothetical protein
MAQGSADTGHSDERERMSRLRLELIELGWVVFHPEPHCERWFAAACNLPMEERSGIAQVGAGTTPLEALENVHRQVLDPQRDADR